MSARLSRRRIGLLLLAVAVLLLVPAAALALLPDTVGRRLLEERLAHLSGRPVAVGHLALRLGVPLRARLTDVTVGAPSAPLLTVARADALIPWSMLAGGPFHLDELDLVHAQLAADLSQQGAQPGRHTRPLRIPWVDRLTVSDGKFHVVVPNHGVEVTGRLFTDTAGLHAEGHGDYGGQPLTLHALAGPFRPGAETVPVGAVVTVEHSALGVRGAVGRGGADLEVSFGGAGLGQLLAHLHPVFRHLPPTGGSAHLVRQGRRWRLSGIDMAFGPNRVTGDLTVTMARRPRVEGWIGTSRLVLGPWGNPHGKRPEALRFPRRLRDFDGDVALRIDDLDLLRVPLRLGAAEIDFHLEDSVLKARLQRAQALPGTLSGDLALDLRQTPPVLDLKLHANRLSVAEMLSGSRHPGVMRGSFSGQLRVDGRGESPGAVLADSRGELTLAIQRGRVDARLVEKIGQDLIALLFPDKKGSAPITCAVADFNLNRGRLESRTTVLATPETVVRGSGDVDLVRRDLDLTLVGSPRKGLRLTPEAPVHVRGQLHAPHASAETSQIAGKAAGALALGALVNPLAALIPFVAIGDDDGGSPCQELLGKKG